MLTSAWVEAGLLVVFAVVLVGPFASRTVEENLEVFFLLAGIAAASVPWVWSGDLLHTALVEPVAKGIVPGVLAAGLVFHVGRAAMDRALSRVATRVPLAVIVSGVILALGLASSLITAVIAALVLSELLGLLPLSRHQRVEVAVVACFAIGLGAVFTPVGEPLSTVAITALSGEPHHAGFLFLFRLLAVYVLPWVLLLAVLGGLLVHPRRPRALWALSLPDLAAPGDAVPGTAGQGKATDGAPPGAHDAEHAGDREETLWHVVVRAVKVYAFVTALILLGAGMAVLSRKYLVRVPAAVLYWVNTTSAVLDNATLAAAEVGPTLDRVQIRNVLMGLLISGGMLVPGNIPNIICASKLRITAKQWARVGLPLGAVMLLVTFLVLCLAP